MQVIFVRHAAAEPMGKVPEGQKLTADGIRQAKTVAIALRAMNLHPEQVLTSPLLHAAETAAIIAREFGVKIDESPSLLPPGDDVKLRQQLANLLDQDAQTVLFVGHAPSLQEMLSDIVADTRRVGMVLDQAGAALIELPVEDAPNGAMLRWLLEYGHLAAVAAALKDQSRRSA